MNGPLVSSAARPAASKGAFTHSVKPAGDRPPRDDSAFQIGLHDRAGVAPTRAFAANGGQRACGVVRQVWPGNGDPLHSES
jgi:hypothetical protein